MSAKHTPGPWRAEQTPASAYWDWTVMAPSGEGRTMQIGIDTDNTEADARLIAAAPELLASLRRCTPLLNSARLASADKAYLEIAGEAVEEALAAIAKAGAA
jgi:hypothetical protein